MLLILTILKLYQNKNELHLELNNQSFKEGAPLKKHPSHNHFRCQKLPL